MYFYEFERKKHLDRQSNQNITLLALYFGFSWFVLEGMAIDKPQEVIPNLHWGAALSLGVLILAYLALTGQAIIQQFLLFVPNRLWIKPHSYLDSASVEDQFQSYFELEENKNYTEQEIWDSTLEDLITFYVEEGTHNFHVNNKLKARQRRVKEAITMGFIVISLFALAWHLVY